MGPRRTVGRRLLLAAGLTGLLVLAGCSNALRWEPDYHTVREGETLYSIAFRYGLDQRQLASWNGLGSGRLIYPGQRLKLTGPAVSGSGRSSRSAGKAPAPRPPAIPVSDWRWPTSGQLIAGFNSSPKTQSGIQLGGQRGQSVQAASAGQIVYAGSGLKSYGQLVIIKHNATFLSAYGYNEALLVKEGDSVKRGQPIARMGQGPGRRAMLHFEIRRNGQPVNPLSYLPKR
ncbi:MAG: peptidoglycan DD-metalloendopeptidase family protein [Gammaproteobacteria bacterium]